MGRGFGKGAIMKYNGKKVNFSDNAMKQIEHIYKYLPYLEGRIERNDIKDDLDREIFVKTCDDLEACLEHLKSEVINNE